MKHDRLPSTSENVTVREVTSGEKMIEPLCELSAMGPVKEDGIERFTEPPLE